MVSYICKSWLNTFMNINPISSIGSISQSGYQLAPAVVAQKNATLPALNSALQTLNGVGSGSSLSFHIDVATDSVVIKVMDNKTAQIIGQIPTEQALRVAQRVANGANLNGMLVENTA